jgi:quercetin dioxygenase-like cupin family protein
MRILAVLIAVSSGGVLAWAQAPAEHRMMAPNELSWGPAPPVFQKGAKMAVLAGDPTKPGLFVIRLKLPAGYKIMPHWHPTVENVTIISGEFAVGMGDKLDPNTKAMGPGAFVSLPPNMHHYGFATQDSIVEVASPGPFALTYVNPADDPTKK